MPEHPLIITARTVSFCGGRDRAFAILDARAGLLLRANPASAATPEWLAELKHLTDQAAEIIYRRFDEERPTHTDTTPARDQSLLYPLGS